MHINYPEIGICGLSCRLCPMYKGHSKSYYCISVTVLELEELKEALTQSKKQSDGIDDIKEKSKILHSILDNISLKKKYYLKLRK